ncbi:MAG: hypothetical protein H0U95_05260 [Bacteroidetes bacterium]|nr:hypothetical protein [Bacteroidota bacterium]
MSFSVFSNSTNNSDAFHIEHKVSTPEKHDDSNSSQVVIEERGNETESNFISPAFIVPFLIYFYHLDSTPIQFFSSVPRTEKLTNPICISGCNFRI